MVALVLGYVHNSLQVVEAEWPRPGEPVEGVFWVNGS